MGGRRGKEDGGRINVTAYRRPGGRETEQGGWWEDKRYCIQETRWEGDRARYGGRIKVTACRRPGGRETEQGGWWENKRYCIQETRWEGDGARRMVGE